MTIKQAIDRANAYLECAKCEIYGICHTCKNTEIMDEFEFDEALETLVKSAKAWDSVKKYLEEEKEFAYADFERYKVECLGQDWDDVYDSLPQDDFRYGLARAIEIINQHLKGVAK